MCVAAAAVVAVVGVDEAASVVVAAAWACAQCTEFMSGKSESSNWKRSSALLAWC